jgi:hypothetical protein
MAGLLEPYIPNFGDWAKSATQGYALGDTIGNRNLQVDAGGLAAKGNLTGARNTLYKGGDFAGAGQIDDRYRASLKEAKTERLEQAKRFNDMMGNIARIADTPEKWTKAVTGLGERGLDVSKYRDFAARDFALSQAGMVGDALKDELERRKLEIMDEKTAASVAARNQPKPRNLSMGDIEKLTKKGQQFENVNRYAETFKDENAGYGRGGETTMWLARNLPILTGPKTEGSATWWQDYDRYKNIVRNELFGSALTAAETEAFEKSDINPNMSPALIRQNLARQQEAVKSALRKNTGALKASGYPEDAVDAATGVTDDQIAPAAAAPASGGNRTRIDLGKGTQQPGSKSDPLGILD